MFCTVSDEIRHLAVLRSKSAAIAKPEDAILQIIEQTVAERDTKFVKHDIAISAAEQSKTALVSQEICDSVVSKFYKKVVVADLKLSAIPESRAVARFADEQIWQKKYFTEINTEIYEVKVPRYTLGGITPLLKGFEKPDYFSERRVRPVSL